MSKKFKSQDYFRYKKLGKRWRKPVGWQSKLRLSKGGSGRMPAIGYRTALAVRGKINGMDVSFVNNANDLSNITNGVAFISSGVGAKKVGEIEKKSKELGIRILNIKKVKHARKLAKSIEKKKAETKAEKKKEENKLKEAKVNEEKKTADEAGNAKKEKDH